MSWGKRRRPHLAEDHAKRQGEVTRLAFLALGREPAIAFLNTPHAGLGGRPLDVATASDEGRDSVEAEIGRLAYAAPRDGQATPRATEPNRREVSGDQGGQESVDAHFRPLRDTRDPRAAAPDAAASE